MYMLTSRTEPKSPLENTLFQTKNNEEFNTTKALSEKNEPLINDLNAENSDISDDDFDFYKARESADQLQNDFLNWQGSTQKKKAAESINTATEYDTWVKDERAKLSKTLSENQQKYFNYFKTSAQFIAQGL